VGKLTIAMENLISEFISETCAIRPRPNRLMVRAIAMMYRQKALNRDDEFMHNNVTKTITGSVSEFYIEPMLPFIGDVDIMWYKNRLLITSFVDRVHRYTQLPSEFHTRNEIDVYEMISFQATCSFDLLSLLNQDVNICTSSNLQLIVIILSPYGRQMCQ
jgi:hypothetical protein